LKEIIDEHLHRPGFRGEWLEVEVADRAAVGGRRAIQGAEIKGASGGFIELSDGARIPMHRVRIVRSRGAIVYERIAKP